MIGPAGYGSGRELDAPHGSRAAPMADCIFWRPLSGEPRGPGSTEYPIYVRQRALAALHDHFRGASQQGILGFLVGALLEDPTTRDRWLEVEFIVRLTQAIYGDKTTLVISRVWERLQQEVVRTGGHMLGWYHSHPPLGIEIAPGDIEAHEQYFGRPWQLALVLGLGPEGPAGAFYRPSAGLPLGTTPLPFYEIVARDSITPEGRRRTRVAWKNYKPDLKRTSGAMTGVSAVLQALHAPSRLAAAVAPAPDPPAPAPPPPRRRITPPRGSAAIRLPEPPPPAAALPPPGARGGPPARGDAELHVPPTLLRSALSSPAASPPDAVPIPAAPPSGDRQARAVFPPQPPAPPAAAPSPAPPPPRALPLREDPAPARAAATAAPPAPPAPPPAPRPPPPETLPGRLTAAARASPPEIPPEPATPEGRELLARTSGAVAAPEGEAPEMPRFVRPRARPTQEVLKDLAAAISGPHRRLTLPGPEAAAEAPGATTPGGRATSEPARVTFTPAPAPAPPAPAEPEPEPEGPAEDAIAPEPPALAFTPGVRRSGAHEKGHAVTAPEPLPAGLREPVWISSERSSRTAGVDLSAPTAPLRPAVEVFAPRHSSPRGFSVPVSRARPSGPLWFLAVVVVGLAAGAWWLLLGSQRLAVPVGVEPTAASAEAPVAPPPDTVQVAQAQPQVQPPPVAPPEAGSAAPAADAPPGALALFDAVFDSLTGAIVDYQNLALRFDAGERDCPGLATTLITVDRLWIAYNARRRGVTLDSLRRELDQGVYSNVESVDGHFRQSGCPRP